MRQPCAKRFCSSLLLIATFCSAGAQGTEWLEFRGRAGQGHAAAQNLPVTWSESDNIRWKVDVPGLGWSSPVVMDDRIYLTTAISVEEDTDRFHSLRALCLGADDGRVIWNQELFRVPDESSESHKKNSLASPTPVLEDGRIYVHFGPYGTACLDLDGNEIWSSQGLQYLPQHGTGGSPAIFRDILVVCCDGRDQRYVAGLRKSDGEEVWRTNRELSPSRGFSFSTPTFVAVNGRTQAICPGSGGVWSYDPQTGRQLWRVNYGEGYSVVPRPVVAHDMVYVCSGFGDGQLLAIDPGGTGDVTDSHVKWRTTKGVPKSPSILVVGSEIFMVDDKGVATCLDAITGNLHWQQRLKGKYSASPVFADGRIYFQNETGLTTVIHPATTYEELARNQLGNGRRRTFASFAFVDRGILLRSETHLYRIEKTDSSQPPQ